MTRITKLPLFHPRLAYRYRDLNFVSLFFFSPATSHPRGLFNVVVVCALPAALGGVLSLFGGGLKYQTSVRYSLLEGMCAPIRK